MINWIFSLVQRPEKGWDPVPAAWAQKYALQEWSSIDDELLDRIEQKIGGYKNKAILDLGGGPGQYSVAFAKKGALVTWHDISTFYCKFTKNKAEEVSVKIDFSLGYLEESEKLNRVFDFILNRVCWCYSMNDKAFTKIVYNLLTTNGMALFIMDHTGFFSGKIPFGQKVRMFFNEKIGLKIGHPFCTIEHVKRIFSKIPFSKVEYEIFPQRIYVWVSK